jgi:hypothetical protein
MVIFYGSAAPTVAESRLRPRNPAFHATNGIAEMNQSGGQAFSASRLATARGADRSRFA